MARMTKGSLPQSPQCFSTNYLGDFRISHLLKIQRYSKIICVLILWRRGGCVDANIVELRML